MTDTLRYHQAEHYARVTELNPTYGNAYLNLGLIMKNRGEHEVAANHMRRAIELDPIDPRPVVNLASLLHRQLNDPGEAVHMYRKALSLYGSYASARVNLGILCAEHLRDDVEAESQFRQALTINPRMPEAMIYLAQLLASKESGLEEALKLCKQCISDNPNFDEAHFIKGKILASNKKYEDAALHYREVFRRFIQFHTHLFPKAIKLNPANHDARYNLAVLLHDKFANDDEAISHLQRIISSAPSHSAASAMLGKVQAKIDLEAATPLAHRSPLLSEKELQPVPLRLSEDVAPKLPSP